MNYRSLLKKYHDRGLREVENNLQVCAIDNFSLISWIFLTAGLLSSLYMTNIFQL